MPIVGHILTKRMLQLESWSLPCRKWMQMRMRPLHVNFWENALNFVSVTKQYFGIYSLLCWSHLMGHQHQHFFHCLPLLYHFHLQNHHHLCCHQDQHKQFHCHWCHLDQLLPLQHIHWYFVMVSGHWCSQSWTVTLSGSTLHSATLLDILDLHIGRAVNPEIW